MESSSAENSFDLVLSKTRQALGACLMSFGPKQINTTTAFSAMMWAVISLAKEANIQAGQGRPELAVDCDMVARFSSLMIGTNWNLDPDLAGKFKDIAFHNCKASSELLN